MKKKKTYDKAVANAAPLASKIGIKIIFKIIFKIQEIPVTKTCHLVFSEKLMPTEEIYTNACMPGRKEKKRQ